MGITRALLGLQQVGQMFIFENVRMASLGYKPRYVLLSSAKDGAVLIGSLETGCIAQVTEDCAISCIGLSVEERHELMSPFVMYLT